MHARVTRFEGAPDKADEFIKYTKETIIPSAKKISGFKGGYWLLDRQSGKGLSVTLFETEAALKASEDSAGQIRNQATQVLGAKMTGIERYEVVAQAVVEPAMSAR